MWLSSFALFPLGVFLTYKAMNDSALFNPEAYGKFFRKIFFIKVPQKISEEDRAVIINNIPDISEISNLNLDGETLNNLQAMDEEHLRDINKNYTQYGYAKNMQLATLIILKARGADINSIVDNQSYEMAGMNYQNFCKSSLLTGIGYLLAIIFLIINVPGLSIFIYVSYLILFVRSSTYYSMFYAGAQKKSKIYHIVISIVSFAAYPLTYWYIKKDMEKNLKELKERAII
jgi:lipopolysaccharide export system permease protein